MGCGCSQPLVPTSLPVATHQAANTVAKTVDDFVPYEDPRVVAMKHYFTGNAYKERGELDRAIEEFTSAVHEMPDFAQAYHERGLAYYKLQEWEYAASDFTNALSYKRDFPAALSYRGATRLELGHLQNAVDDCTAAIRLSPEDPHPYTVRGNAYIKLGDSDRGLDDLEKGGELEVLRLCLVCMENPRGARIHPCQHAGLCAQCAKEFKEKNYACPLCSQSIENLEFGIFKSTFSYDSEFAPKGTVLGSPVLVKSSMDMEQR